MSFNTGRGPWPTASWKRDRLRVGSVRCDAVGEGRFTAVALEMDPGTRVFTTLPVFPAPVRARQWPLHAQPPRFPVALSPRKICWVGAPRRG